MAVDAGPGRGEEAGVISLFRCVYSVGNVYTKWPWWLMLATELGQQWKITSAAISLRCFTVQKEKSYVHVAV